MVGARSRLRRLIGLVLLLLLLLSGCDFTVAAPASRSVSYGPGATETASAAPICATARCGATGVQVFVEPDAGAAPVLQAIEGANISLDVEVYLLTDRIITDALEDAAARGVDVHVLLDPHPYGFSAVSVQQTLDTLAAAGVHAQDADPAYYYTHAKLLIADGATAFVGSENFSATSLDQNRELGIIVSDPHALATLGATFAQDWSLGGAA